MTVAQYALPALASVCSKPANGGLLQGNANRLRRPALFLSAGAEKPKDFANLHHGGASHLRRPALFLSAGAESLRIWPVCIMAAQAA